MSRIIVIDVETTGMSVKRGGRVIEVGAVALDGNCIVDELDTLIDTGAVISYGAYQVHGISEEMLRGKPQPDEAWNHVPRKRGDEPETALKLAPVLLIRARIETF